MRDHPANFWLPLAYGHLRRNRVPDADLAGAEVPYRRSAHGIGDITQGGSPLLTPPVWACGMWFDNPSSYRWVDGYGNTISSANPSHDVIVWVSKPGCPESFSIVHGNNTLVHPAGAIYLEITVPSDGPGYGARWIDENGERPFCGGRSGADELTDLPQGIDALAVTLSGFRTVSVSLLDARLQPGIGTALASLAGEIGWRQLMISQKVSARRATTLGDYELIVRPLEDVAVQGLASAKALLDSSAALARQKGFGDAFTLCTLASRAVEAAQSALTLVHGTLAVR